MVGLCLFLFLSCASRRVKKMPFDNDEVLFDFENPIKTIDENSEIDELGINLNDSLTLTEISNNLDNEIVVEKIVNEEDPVVLAMDKELEDEIIRAEEEIKNFKELPLDKKVEENFNRSAREKESRFVNSITEYLFQDALIYTILVSTNMITDIRLEAGEQILGDVAIADSLSYIVKSGISYENGKEMLHIYIRATNTNGWTTMIIPTNRRIYYLKLVPTTKTAMFAVRFNYEETGVLLGKSKANKDLTDLKNLDFNYKIDGNSQIKPNCVFSSDRNTYIQFPPSFLSSSLAPALYLDSSSGLSIVNYSIRSNLYIVDFILSKDESFVLICDGKKVNIKREMQ